MREADYTFSVNTFTLGLTAMLACTCIITMPMAAYARSPSKEA